MPDLKATLFLDLEDSISADTLDEGTPSAFTRMKLSDDVMVFSHGGDRDAAVIWGRLAEQARIAQNQCLDRIAAKEDAEDRPLAPIVPVSDAMAAWQSAEPIDVGVAFDRRVSSDDYNGPERRMAQLRDLAAEPVEA